MRLPIKVFPGSFSSARNPAVKRAAAERTRISPPRCENFSGRKVANEELVRRFRVTNSEVGCHPLGIRSPFWIRANRGPSYHRLSPLAGRQRHSEFRLERSPSLHGLAFFFSPLLAFEEQRTYVACAKLLGNSGNKSTASALQPGHSFSYSFYFFILNQFFDSRFPLILSEKLRER